MGAVGTNLHRMVASGLGSSFEVKPSTTRVKSTRIDNLLLLQFAAVANAVRLDTGSYMATTANLMTD